MVRRVLLIDDDTELTRLLSEFLSQEGFEADAHGGGLDAVERATSGLYELIVLDVMLPRLNGFEVLKQIRRSSALPVILLTARGDDADRIRGLEIGADDYVPKPFNPRELAARINAVLRRGRLQQGRERHKLQIDDVVLDPASRTVFRDAMPVDLTTVEFDILRLLLEAAPEAVAREAIAEKVLGRQFDPQDRSVDMHVSKLRRKLGDRADREERIKTIRTIGYMYTLPSRGVEVDARHRA